MKVRTYFKEVLIFILLMIITTLILGILNSAFSFNDSIISPVATFLGALSGAAITGGIAIKVAQDQNMNQNMLFEEQVKKREEELQSEKRSIEFNKNYNQIVVLFYIEKDLIIMMQECIKLNKQYRQVIQNDNLYQTVSKVKFSDGKYWMDIDKIIDVDLRIKLQMFREQYDSLVNLHRKSTIEYQDELELVSIEIEKLLHLEKDNKITKEERVHLKQKQLKKLNLEADWEYYYQEKQYAWNAFSDLAHYEFGEDLRKRVRGELEKSCDFCGVEEPIDLSQFINY
ncbi:YrzE family protein [Lysinibacillus agricola]|uniref:YrzE family protein n=1 Tax=Lysinibacillus agricola TaxID=2590012 RepID=A0ABX7AXX6_9BACI|nr:MULTISPECIES: YrzE family protein [Lysinibacillus]KOS60581.1 hypothetical protein AN161_22545 [Lysinibacillus sp. FJAT-14222]QQP14666.1 YrzE family protein [Lysinibacillus agricola]